MKCVVSACLMGRNCKYNGGNNRNPRVMAFLEGKEVIEVCPEALAGLGTPRIPMEIVNGVITDREGTSHDAPVRAAVARILAQLAGEEIECVVLQSRSPTCGVHQVYDGTFTGTRIPGMGILAQALQAAGYRLIDAEDLP